MTPFESLKNLVEKPISGEWGDGEGKINVIRTANFRNDGRIDFSNIVKRDINVKKVEDKKLFSGDIIIEKSGGSPSQPVGRVVFFEAEDLYLCNNFTSILRPLSDNVFPKYLHYILFCNHKFGVVTKFQNKTTGIINLKLANYLEKTKVPLPSLAEQKKIAAILDAADSLRQKDQQLVEHYTALSQSLFLEMFGDLNGAKVPLSSLCKLNPPKSEITKTDKSTYVSFVPMTNVSEVGKVNLSDKRSLNEVWSGFTYFAENDVVFAKITPCMENGKGAIMRGLLNGVGFGTTEFHVLRPIQNISTPEWLYSLTTQKFFRQYAELNMTGSAGQKRVPKQFFDNYMVVQPTIEKQNQFAERVAIIEQQKQQAQINLQNSEALFNSLLQRAFTGELTADKAA